MKKLTPRQASNGIFKYLTNIEQAKRSTVKVGILSSSIHVYPDGETVAEVGAQHEYGTEDVPRRSFLRAPFYYKQEEMESAIETQFKSIAEKGKDSSLALNLIGVTAQTIVQDAFITQGYGEWQPNSQRTIEEKGSSQPLIDTGALRQSITYGVES